MNLIVSMLVIVGLLFGGSATIAAAQDDLPNEPLYQLKLMSEDVKLWLSSDRVTEIQMLMEQAQTRTQEIAALTSKGITPSGDLTLRSQERIQRALQLAASLDEPAQSATLQQIRTQLHTQELLMNQLQEGSCSECEPVLQQTREMLRNQLNQDGSGPSAPQSSPNQNQNQNQIRTTQTPLTTDDTVAPQGSCTPALDGTGEQNGTGQQSGSGNPSVGTPMPQNNNTTNQNGGGTQNDNDKGNENGPMPGSGNQNGPGGQGGKP